MRQLGIVNVKIQVFDGTVGWSEVAPFDRILVTAGAPTVPKPLLDQLAPRGRLLIPEGDRRRQRLVLYERIAGRVRRLEGEDVAFVPLVGRHGWQQEEKGRE
jgi:protein-L-isoaspartate(D-aspartate) O-methyltransferase